MNFVRFGNLWGEIVASVFIIFHFNSLSNFKK